MGIPEAVEEFILWHIPAYVLIFCVLFIILAKGLNNALAAMPLAIIGTAATGALLAVQSNIFLNAPIIALGDVIMVLGISVVVLLIYAMMKAGVQ